MNLLLSFILVTFLSNGYPTNQSSSLPEEFTLAVDFKIRWPFKDNWFKPFEQDQTKGDTYTYVYKKILDCSDVTEEFDFVICGNKTNYRYLKSSDGNVMFLQPDPKSATTRITLPAVPGRYLKSITLEVTNKYPKRFEIVDTKTWKVMAVSQGSTNLAPSTVSFPMDGITTQANQPYYLRLVDKNTLVTGIILVYSSTL